MSVLTSEQAYQKMVQGTTMTVSQFAEESKISVQDAQKQLDWLCALEREWDDAGLPGVDCIKKENELVYGPVHVDAKICGSYDMRGPVDLYWTDKVVFYVGLNIGYFLRAYHFDGGINITASHNAASDDGVKWCVRAMRSDAPIALVGGGIRNTTPRIKEKLILGLRHAGVQAMDIGTTATPEVYHALACYRDSNENAQEIKAADFRFIRPLNSQEVADIYAALPSKEKPMALLQLQERLRKESAQFKNFTDYTKNSFVEDHNTWVKAFVRLGPDVCRELFESWVLKKDDFPSLIQGLKKTEWPDQVEASFWKAFCEKFEIPFDSFPSMPESAVSQPFSGKKIGTDFANGSNWRKTQLLEDLGFEVFSVKSEKDGKSLDSAKPDGNFPIHHPDPTKPEYQRFAIDLARKETIPVVLFDEDGDRFALIDETGTAVNGSELAVLLAEAMSGPVLADVRYPRYAVERLLKSGRILNETFFRGPVGYAYYIEAALLIQQGLQKKQSEVTIYPNCPNPVKVDLEKVGQPVTFGIEPSGHAFFCSNGYANDASYLLGAVLWYLRKLYGAGKDIKTVFQAIAKNPSSPPELRILMTPDISVAERRTYVQKVLEAVQVKAEEKNWKIQIDFTDGGLVEWQGEAGEVFAQALLRNSNNESVFGLAFEGRSHEHKHQLEELLLSVLADTCMGEVGVDFASPRTSEYLKIKTPENQENGKDHPPVLARIRENTALWTSLSSEAKARIEKVLS